MTRPIVTALLGLALCLAAATFDSASLYVPGVGLIVLAVGATAWVLLAAQGAGIARRAGPHTVVEEDAYPLRVETTAGLLPPPGGELWEPLLGWPVPIAGRWSRRLRINVRFSRRGRRVLEPGRLVIRDPLRLFTREIVGSGGEEVLVLPRVEPVTSPGGSGAGAGEHGGSGAEPGLSGRRLDASMAELEIDGLRPYREGAPASRIHWPSVARRGEMLERRLVAELDSAPLIVLDASSPADEESLDKAVRAAGSLSLWLARKGAARCCSRASAGRSRSGTTSGPGRRCTCAWRWWRLGAPPAAAALGPRAGAVLWVTGADLRAAPRALERLPAGARYVVAPSPPAGVRAAFEVAGCSGCQLQRARRGVAA